MARRGPSRPFDRVLGSFYSFFKLVQFYAYQCKAVVSVGPSLLGLDGSKELLFSLRVAFELLVVARHVKDAWDVVLVQ